jgi:hypothetical protein
MRRMLIQKLKYITTELALVNLDPKPDLMKELTDIGNQLKDGWEKALNDFDPEQLKKYKMALACENVPTLVISLANIVVETTNSFGQQEDICQPIVDFFVNICSKNDIGICLLFCYSSIDKMKAWMASDPIKIPYVLKYVLGSDETSPYQLLYSHTSVFESILGCYRATIALFEESLGGEPFDAEKYCEYWSKLDPSHIDKQEELQEKSMQHDLLLSIYLYNTMFIDLIRKGNKDFQSKYYDLQMAKEVFKMMIRMKDCFNKNQESQEVHKFIREDLERAKLEKTMIPPLKNYDRLSKEDFIFYFDTQFRERLDQEKQTIAEGQDPQKKMAIQDSIQIKWMVIAVFRSTMDLFVKSSQRCFLPSVGQEGHKAFKPEIQFDLLDNNTIGLLRLSSSYLQLKASIHMSIVSGSLFMPKTWVKELAEHHTEEHQIVYTLDFSFSCLDIATKELQNLKTIKWESIYSEAQEQAFRESINKTFRIYLFEGLLPLIYKNCMFFLHYCRTDDFDIFKLMSKELRSVFEAFFLEFYPFRKIASSKEENWAKRNLLFDHNQLNTLDFISNLDNESGGYALRLRNDSLEEIMKRREMVDAQNRREKSDKGGSESKIGLHSNRSVKEGALKPSNMLKRNSVKAAEKYKKPGVSKNQKLDQISSMVNTKLMMKNQSRKLTKEELLAGTSKQSVAEEYFEGLEEDDRIYAEIEAFKILFQDIAEYIEFNYAQHDLQLEKTNQADLELMKEKLKNLSSDRKMKEDEKRRKKRPVEIELRNKTDSLKYETCSHILKMYQKELPVNQYSVKYLIFQDVNLNDCSSIALEKFYRDKKNVHKQVDDNPPKELFLRYKHLDRLIPKKEARGSSEGSPRQPLHTISEEPEGQRRGSDLLYPSHNQLLL